MKMNKLYFEGAGMFGTGGKLNNCRIRTAFTNNEGEKIYLEMGTTYRYNEKMKPITDKALRIDFMHYITENEDDCNNSRIPFDWREVREMDYDKNTILTFINERLNCSFDDFEILPNLAGYRVHADKNGYNFGDEFNYNEDLIGKMA